MKKLFLVLSLSLSILLAACASLDTYEDRLENAGWDVETADVADLPDIIDSETVSEETGINGILYATKGNDLDELAFGFIIEFNDSDDAQQLYADITENGANDFENNVAVQRHFVFFGTSQTFLVDLNVD